MERTGLTTVILATAACFSPPVTQAAPAQEPADLKVELRSVTGSNRFQLGEVIMLEVLISSRTPNRYLEPCKMFWESCFGYPQCRFVNQWYFDVVPSTGWTDIGWHGCGLVWSTYLKRSVLPLVREESFSPASDSSSKPGPRYSGSRAS